VSSKSTGKSVKVLESSELRADFIKQELPTVSVIIPSKNRQLDLDRCLRSILAQKTKAREIIVVDQSDSRYKLPQISGLIQLYWPNLSGLTAARNIGLLNATSDIVFFLDDDCELLSDCVGILAKAFVEQPGAVAISCNLKTPRASSKITLNKLGTYVFELGFFSLRPVNSKVGLRLRNATGVAGYRRWIFQHELFDENLTGYCTGEDWEFSRRASRYGYITRASEALVNHHVSPVNRLDLQRRLVMRWKNYMYFYDKLAENNIGDRACRLWWLVGESIKWYRQGMGFPLFGLNERFKSLSMPSPKGRAT
jgi:glycosyltransferase involved in cell wall biosynthesis